MALSTSFHPFASSPFEFDTFFSSSPFEALTTHDNWMSPRLANFEHHHRNNWPTQQSVAAGYQVHEDDKKYSIAIDVPGIKQEDIIVKLDDNGRVLHLSGSRKMKEGSTVSTMKFEKQFTLGDNVETDQISASLNDGVLELMVPKKEKEEEELTSKVIPITQCEANK